MSVLLKGVRVALGERSYPILIGSGLLSDPERLAPLLRARTAAVISNDVVGPLYLPVLRESVQALGIRLVEIELPDGEKHKDWTTLNRIFDALLAARCDRRTPLLALGGGVVGDLTGFAAASYLRGVPFVQIPTTLLAQVDSSVGGKTGINHPLGKNMIGAFYQPQGVIADLDTLRSLPRREFCSGLAEVIKYGLIQDPDFFAWLEENMPRLLDRDADALAHAVGRCCEIKAQIVSADEREGGLRAILNLGHTFGHAIEAGLGFGQWLHGEAVSAGMLAAARLSAAMGWLSREEVERTWTLLEAAGLPTASPDLGTARYLELMSLDKKVEDGQIRLILLRGIGQAVVSADYPRSALEGVLEGFRSAA